MFHIGKYRYLLNLVYVVLFFLNFCVNFSGSKSPSIILLTFLYGTKIPPLFDLYWLSTWKNPDIQFRVLSDSVNYSLIVKHIANKTSKILNPENVKFLKIPWATVNAALRVRLNSMFDLNITEAYKLCDFKVTFFFAVASRHII